MKTSKLMILMMVFIVISILFSLFAEAKLSDIASNFKSRTQSGYSSFKAKLGEFKTGPLIVNSLILIGLIVLIIYFFGDKINPKQRGALIILAIVISVLIAWTFRGDFLWRLENFNYFFKVKVLVNIAVISLFIYVLYMYFTPEATKTALGKYVPWILIIMFASMFATASLKEGLPYSEYKYIWNFDNIIPIRYYLLGDKHCLGTGKLGFIDDNEIKLADGSEIKRYDDGTYMENDLIKNDKVRMQDGKRQIKHFFMWRDMEGENLDETFANYEELEKAKNTGQVSDDLNSWFKLQEAKLGKSRFGRYCYSDKTIEDKKRGITSTSDYVLKDEEVKGFGILRGQQIFVFIFATLLLAWLFSIWKIGGESKKLSYLVALIVGASLAHAGMGKSAFIKFAQFTFMYLLYKGQTAALTGEKLGWKKATAGVISFIITQLIFTTAFPKESIGVPLNIGQMIMYGIILIIVVALGGGGIFLGAKGTYNYLSSFGKHASGEIWRHLIDWYRAVLEWVHLSDKFPTHDTYKGPKEDAWPYSFMRNRPFLQVLQHYHKRTEIYFNYWRIVQQNMTYYPREIRPKIKGYEFIDTIIKDMPLLRSGAYRGGRETLDWDVEDYKNGRIIPYGWNAINLKVVDLINDSNKLIKDMVELIKEKAGELSNIYENKDLSDEDREKAKVNAIGKEKVQKMLGKIADLTKGFLEVYAPVEKLFEKYEHMRLAYGYHNVIKRMRQDMIDMCNISGAADHTYLIAPKGAKLVGSGELEENKEVDIDGNVIDDIKGGNKNPRRVALNKRKEIKYYNNYDDFLTWINGDWKYFIYDLRDGRFHPYSRTFVDYQRCIKDSIYSDKKVKKVETGPHEGNPAFDLRALKNPGRFDHGGRAKFNDIPEQTRYNPCGDVCVSTQGLAMYFVELAYKAEKERDLVEDRLQTLPGDFNESSRKKVIELLSKAKPEERG